MPTIALPRRATSAPCPHPCPVTKEFSGSECAGSKSRFQCHSSLCPLLARGHGHSHTTTPRCRSLGQSCHSSDATDKYSTTALCSMTYGLPGYSNHIFGSMLGPIKKLYILVSRYSQVQSSHKTATVVLLCQPATIPRPESGPHGRAPDLAAPTALVGLPSTSIACQNRSSLVLLLTPSCKVVKKQNKRVECLTKHRGCLRSVRCEAKLFEVLEPCLRIPRGSDGERCQQNLKDIQNMRLFLDRARNPRV